MPDANRQQTVTLYKNGAPVWSGPANGGVQAWNAAIASGVDPTGTTIQGAGFNGQSMSIFANTPGANPPPAQSQQPLPNQPPLQANPPSNWPPPQGSTNPNPTTPINTFTVDPNAPVNSDLPTIPGLSTPTTPVNAPTVQTDISSSIPATSQQQQNIVNQGIAQSQNVAGQNVASLQSILGPYVQQQFSQYTDPNSPANAQMMGELNNMGMADSGAFPQALASRLAPLLSQDYMQLGTSALEPSFQTQQSLVQSGTEDQSNLGLASLQRYIDQQNFQNQSTLANQLADKGQPSNFQQGVGGASSLLGGLGGFFQGLPGLKQVTSGTWICTHLKKLGLATEEEVKNVHHRLYPSVFRHPLHWMVYLAYAPRLIEYCDAASVDWKAVKEVLVDQVLAEPDSEKAWQIYRAECQRLTLRYAPELWKLEVA